MFVPPEPDPTLQLTIDKVETITKEASTNGASLIVFPEAFISAYPKGLDFGAQYHEEFYNLPNFAEYAEEIILKNKPKNIITLPITPRIHNRPMTPFIPFIPPESNNKYIELNTVKSLPSKIPFIRKYIN